jgi:hypothetical protein
MSIKGLADLELVVCDRQVVELYRDPFYVRCSRFLLALHQQTMERVNGTWVFSKRLQDDIMRSYPWDLQCQFGWIIELGGLFFQWLQRAPVQYVEPHRKTTPWLDPPLFAAYVARDYPHLEREWLWVLECAIGDTDQTTVICSFEPRPDTVTLQGTATKPNPETWVLRNEADWQKMLESQDSWLRHGLPREGDYPYVPDRSWPGAPDDFPRRLYRPRNQVGFLDERGRIWIVHLERGQMHWDVQCPPFGRGRYFKVGPDGRLLGGTLC